MGEAGETLASVHLMKNSVKTLAVLAILTTGCNSPARPQANTIPNPATAPVAVVASTSQNYTPLPSTNSSTQQESDNNKIDETPLPSTSSSTQQESDNNKIDETPLPSTSSSTQQKSDNNRINYTPLLSTNSSTQQKSRNSKINEIVEDSGRAIKVKGITETDRLDPHNEYVEFVSGRIILVSFIVANTSNQSGNMMGSQFKLNDAQGRKYNEVENTDTGYTMWREFNGFRRRSNDLYPGESRKDIAAFKVAPHASNFSLEWEGKIIDLNISTDNSSNLQTSDNTSVENSGSKEVTHAISSPSPITDSNQETKPESTSSDHSSSSNRIVKAKDGYANLRSSPSTDVSVLAKMPNGTSVTVLKEEKNSDNQLWYKVQVNNHVGWIYSDLLE